MNRDNRKYFVGALCLLAAFALWTLLVRIVDVQPIGPRESVVGFATMNAFIHNIFGVNITLYTITDWLGLVPIIVAFGFAVLGLAQLINRRSFLRVDYSVLALGVLYVVVIGAYLLFESLVINYRPVLIEGYLEPSYPSSTTLLVLCVIPTATMQFKARVRNTALRNVVVLVLSLFTVFMVVGRIVSGVHWISDIIGGLLLSGGLVTMYRAVSKVYQ